MHSGPSLAKHVVPRGLLHRFTQSKSNRHLFMIQPLFLFSPVSLVPLTQIPDLHSANPKTQNITGPHLPPASICILKAGFLRSTKNSLPLNWLGGFKNSSRTDDHNSSQCPLQTWLYILLYWQEMVHFHSEIAPESQAHSRLLGWFKHWPELPWGGSWQLKEGALQVPVVHASPSPLSSQPALDSHSCPTCPPQSTLLHLQPTRQQDHRNYCTFFSNS